MQLSQFEFGSFTATGSPLTISFAGDPQIVRLYYQANWASSANPGVIKELYWNQNMGAGTGLATYNTNGAATDTKSVISTGGISIYDPASSVPYGPAVTVSSVSQANPAVVTTASAHGYSTGDQVLINNTTGMLQIAGMIFQITVLSSTTFSLNGLNSSGFAAAASAGSVRKVLYPGVWTPQMCYITSITQAADAVITTSIDHGYVAGQLIYLTVPAGFGMTQANRQITQILSVTSNTMTVALNTSAFTAFAFPASALFPVSFPNLSNYGANSSLVLNPYINNGLKGIYLGSSVCGTSGLVHYEILQGDIFNSP